MVTGTRRNNSPTGAGRTMFDRTLRELQELAQSVRISIDVAVDDNGYFDRLCPQEECAFAFKVLLADWKEKVPDEAAHCPFCGHTAAPSEFNTPEQVAYFQEVAKAEVMRRLMRGLSADARVF